MIIWQSSLDNGKYQCKVERIDGYAGTLTVTDTVTGAEVLNATVTLSYGARFGPDIDDVNLWQDIIEKAIPE